MLGRKQLISYLLLSTLLFSSGCWDRRELDDVNVTAGVAFDRAQKNPNNVLITAQIIDQAALGSTQSGAGSEFPVWNIAILGNTIFDAVRNLTHESSSQLFWAHNAVLIFGQALAREGIKADLDWFMRDPEVRNTTLVVIAEDRADEILNTPTRIENIPGLYVSKLIETRSSTSQTVRVNLLEFSKLAMSETTAPVAPIIKMIKQGNTPTLHLLKTAVFDQEVKLIGELDEKETRGLLWVIGEVDSGIIVIDAPECKEKASLEIVDSSSKVVPQIKNGKIHFTVTIHEKGNLSELRCDQDILSSAIWNTMERRKATAIRNEVLAALNKSRELNADIFGFGDAFSKKHPKQWKEIAPHWKEYYPTIEVEVIVITKLCRSGKITLTLPER